MIKGSKPNNAGIILENREFTKIKVVRNILIYYIKPNYHDCYFTPKWLENY